MLLGHFQRQYEQLSQFERGRIIGMMETGLSARLVARQLQEVLDPRDDIYTKTRLRKPSTDQSSRRPPHPRVSQDCLRTVTTLPCPTRSPDLSSIDPILDHLGRRVGHPTNLNELEARLQQIWNEMSQDIIQNLYASMPDRIASCIRARGGSTRY
ncbi:transposable element Tcb1 transposase [Trichonephila clavipes]|nr:transposable element Tcb1 transposase [Trichonephila clavipes]